MAIDISDFSAPDPANSADLNRHFSPRPESIAAFIGRTSRGPIDEPVVIGGFEEFRRTFGGHGPFGFLSVAVEQFFQHGGRTAAVVRVANNARRARLDLPAYGQILRLHAREPGSQMFLRASVDYDDVGSSDNRFNLVIQRLARPSSHLVEDQELFRGLSMKESDPSFVVDALRSSELIQLGGPLPEHRPEATRAEQPGQPLPYVEMSSPGSDGDELTDYDVVGSNDERTGLFALDDLPRIDLLNVPLLASGRDLGTTTFLAAERYCARRRATLIWDPPWAWTSVATALVGVRDAGLASADALSYYPRVSHAMSPERYPHGVPAGGAVAGLLAAADRQGEWDATDRIRGQLRAGLMPVVAIDAREATVLRRSGINVFSARPPYGALLLGNVSLAGASAVSRVWQRLDRRRLLIHLLKSLESNTRWALSAEWTRGFEQLLIEQVRSFLRDLFERGALAGNREQQAFFVKLRSAIGGEEREIVLRVGVALDQPGQFHVYDVVHRAERSIAKPAPPGEAAQLAG